MAAVTTYPCDESAENTGKSEQWRNTRDRALIEEQLERRAEQNKVDPWQKQRVVRPHRHMSKTRRGGSAP
jgi:hypothetical protein